MHHHWSQMSLKFLTKIALLGKFSVTSKEWQDADPVPLKNTAQNTLNSNRRWNWQEIWCIQIVIPFFFCFNRSVYAISYLQGLFVAFSYCESISMKWLNSKSSSGSFCAAVPWLELILLTQCTCCKQLMVLMLFCTGLVHLQSVFAPRMIGVLARCVIV